jgi:hypothetical protein
LAWAATPLDHEKVLNDDVAAGSAVEDVDAVTADINTATVSPPAGVTDNDPGNNSATDSDTLTPQADLSITKTDGVTSVVPGTVDTYTITVTNNGPKWVAGGS